MKISTTYRADAQGEGKVTAKGGGKQRTVNYDHALSPRENHRNAAAALAAKHDRDLFPMTEVIELDKGKAVFSL